MKLAFVDLETTGTSPTYDRIIEVGIVRVEDDKIVATYNKLVNPETYLSPFITNMTGINAEDLEGAPSFYSLKDEIAELLSECIFVAHNARFDYGFIKGEFKRYDMSFSAKQLCTVKLSRKLFPQYKQHNLDSLINRFGFNCENRHRAFDDAKVLFDFYSVLKKTVAAEKLDEVINGLLKKPSLPQHLSDSHVADLPESPGVYIFYDEQHMPLYIGKSINIRDRVLSHFAADHSSSREMKISTNITDIKTIKTTGELGALLLESTLIKEMQPLYNRKLRNAYHMIVLKKYTNDDGYDCVKIETKDRIEPEEMNDIMGVFRSNKQAKDYLRGLSKFYFLCDHLVDLENSKGGCFSSKLGLCRGACEKKEVPIKYNMRFIEAFTKTRIKKWPFPGPIVIHESNDDESMGYLVDQWCCSGKVESDATGEYKNDISFDYDTYKILVQFVMNPKNKKKIKVGDKNHWQDFL